MSGNNAPDVATLIQQQQAMIDGLQTQLLQMQLIIAGNQGQPNPAGDRPAREWTPTRPESFDGSRRDAAASAWLYSVQSYIQAVNMPDHMQLAFIRSLLQGNALTWFRIVEQAQEMPLTWALFMEEFRSHYVSPLVAQTARRELRTLTQRTSVPTFNHAFNRRLIEAEGVPALLALEYYLDALKPEIQERVRVASPVTLRQAQTLAENMETVLTVSNRSQTHAGKLQGRAEGSGSSPMQLGATTIQGSASADSFKGKCFNCGKFGHRARECTKPKKNQAPSN